MRRTCLLLTGVLIATLSLSSAAIADEHNIPVVTASEVTSETPEPETPNPGRDIDAGLDTTAAGEVGGGLSGYVLGGVFDALSGWMVDGARYVLAELFGTIDSATTPQLSAGWFRRHVAAVAQIAAGWMALLFMAAVIDAGVRRRGDVLVRALMMLPLAALGTPVAMFILDLAIAATDAASGWLMAIAGADLAAFGQDVLRALLERSIDGPVITPTPDTGAAGLFAAFLVMMAAGFVWVELLMREAAVYIAALFLPLAFSGVVWPATAHWTPRLLRLEGALVVSKLAITASVSLGATMTRTGGAGGGFSLVIVGIGVLMIAAFTPFVLYRIIQVWDTGQAGESHGAMISAAGRALAPVAAGVGLAMAGQRLVSPVRTTVGSETSQS